MLRRGERQRQRQRRDKNAKIVLDKNHPPSIVNARVGSGLGLRTALIILLAGVVSLPLCLHLVEAPMTAARAARRSETTGSGVEGYGAWIDVENVAAGSRGSFLFTDPASKRKLPMRVFYATPSSMNET